MSKELEALNYLYNDLRLMKHLDIVEEAKVKSAYECLKQVLQKLEAIDNAESSEALECLENLSWFKSIYDNEIYVPDTKEYTTIKNYILKSQEQKRKMLNINN